MDNLETGPYMRDVLLDVDQIYKQLCVLMNREGRTYKFRNDRFKMLVMLEHMKLSMDAVYRYRRKYLEDRTAMSVDDFKLLILAIDDLIACLFGLGQVCGWIPGDFRKFETKLKHAFDDDDDRVLIVKFRYLRGLVIAHPFDMDRGQELTKYLIDVHIPDDLSRQLLSDELGSADIALHVAYTSDRNEHMCGVCWEQDLFAVAVRILKRFEVLIAYLQ